MFGVTAGYHRYFSHRSYRLGRPGQFLMAFLAQTSGQKGVHSPVQRGFWRSRTGWILSNDHDAIRIAAGTRIRYRLSWHGIPVSWTTDIREWKPPFRFVDVQLGGPYRLWHHTHRFESKDGGTRMTDIVRYRLPFGIIGRVMHAIKVRRGVERILEAK
jgi:ligand-binding SRPBCC domain-containing protein